MPYLAHADVTFYTAATGDVITIDPGCPTLFPKNTDKDTQLPYWTKECPPMELCYPGVTLNTAIAPYNARCKDDDGVKWNDKSCCSKNWKKQSMCYGYCQPGYATNLDGKSKVNWKCVCNKNKGCHWAIQGNMNDLTCTECDSARRVDWTTSGRKQADFNAELGALGVDGKILSAGWYHKKPSKENIVEYILLISLQGIELTAEQIMVWDYDLHSVTSEPFGANQWYTFATTLIALTPNAMSPQGPFSEGDITNVLIGLENISEMTQANIDSGMVHYSVGYLKGYKNTAGDDWNVGCMLSHFGANPSKNDMSITNLMPSE